MPKAPGSEVLSGAINGETRADDPRRLASRSIRAMPRIMQVMRDSEQQPAASCAASAISSARGTRRSPSRIALAAWAVERRARALPGGAGRGHAVSAADRAFRSRSSARFRWRRRAASSFAIPAVLEQIDSCRTIIFDKTGTLTYGQPTLDRSSARVQASTSRGAAACRQPGTLFEASAGERHPRGGSAGASGAARRERGERAARRGTRGRRRRPAVQVSVGPLAGRGGSALDACLPP